MSDTDQTETIWLDIEQKGEKHHLVRAGLWFIISVTLTIGPIVLTLHFMEFPDVVLTESPFSIIFVLSALVGSQLVKIWDLLMSVSKLHMSMARKASSS